MPHRFDATLKDILGPDPADLRSAFELPAIVPASPLNVDLSTISAATDVAFGYGEPLLEIVDLNFRSGPDPDLPARIHLYNASYHLKFKVPVRSIVVLLRPRAKTDGLDGKLTYVCGGRRVIFEYDLVAMWKKPVELFLEGGLRLLPLAPLCQLPKGKSQIEALRSIVRKIDYRLAREIDHAQAVRLMTATFILTGMRVAKEYLNEIYDGVKIMHESSAYDMILDEGRTEGGIEIGIRFLLLIGRQQFGAPNSRTKAALTAIQDLGRLERMAKMIVTAKSWKELLATK